MGLLEFRFGGSNVGKILPADGLIFVVTLADSIDRNRLSLLEFRVDVRYRGQIIVATLADCWTYR